MWVKRMRHERQGTLLQAPLGNWTRDTRIQKREAERGQGKDYTYASEWERKERERESESTVAPVVPSNEVRTAPGNVGYE